MAGLRVYTASDEATSLKATRVLGRAVKCHFCFTIRVTKGEAADFFSLNEEKLQWLLSHSPLSPSISLHPPSVAGRSIEIGPNPWQKSAFCSNALSVFESAAMEGVASCERSRIYDFGEGDYTEEELLALLGDPMTERVYSAVSASSDCVMKRESVTVIDVLSDGDAIASANKRLALAFDEEDIHYYVDLFKNKLKRNPTDVELCDLAQSDSEHSRHWFFRGELIEEGAAAADEESLMKRIKDSLLNCNTNNLIAFNDNSSCIRGFPLSILLPLDPSSPSELTRQKKTRHLVYTAETHNFPTAVCPFEGAATGTGGRIRDVHATGRGAHEIAAVAGYSFGCLHLPDYSLPWEDSTFSYPPSFAHPSHIAIQASNGASDYGNKFGEPVICGFARSFGLRVEGRRVEYLKPIMFSGGVGSIDDEALYKSPCDEEMVVAKIGGPAYRIGVGGGAASSVAVQGSREGSADYSAVQRGDAQAGQKLHRLVRACAEMGAVNPIQSIHDQGAGGNGNVLKEIVEGCGAVIEADSFLLGDPSLSLRELWTAEYQENDAILVKKSDLEKMAAISQRENCPFTVVGKVIKEKRMVVNDFTSSPSPLTSPPVDYDLGLLGERHTKRFVTRRGGAPSTAFQPNSHLSVIDALERVLRLPSVASKRYLTSKVDRSVTGLVARQQCCGPLHTPLADVAVVALSFFETVGAAVAVGEQPVKMLADTASGVEMSLAECLTNLVFAPISALRDVKLSGNWMWARDSDGARLADAVRLLCSSMAEVGVAIDGGKDSLSMKAATPEETVTSPGTLVLSAYAPCIDIGKILSPDLKGSESGDQSVVLYIRMDGGRSNRLGGSALAQTCGSIGCNAPRIESWKTFSRVFSVVQTALMESRLLSGHDVSDGGVITALLEMAFAGNLHLEAEFQSQQQGELETLFNEEAALLLEVEAVEAERLQQELRPIIGDVPRVAVVLKRYGPDAKVIVRVNGSIVIDDSLVKLREVWEETSLRLDMLQTKESCVRQAKEERERVRQLTDHVPFSFSSPLSLQVSNSQPRVMILREEGSNGDREMAAAFTIAGFSAFDVTMNDLLSSSSPSLDSFHGIAFVGGFSFSDVLGSAKGWAARIKYHSRLWKQMETFRRRQQSFSLGVCNGCQLMTLLGWVGELDGKPSVSMSENSSGRFESSFVSVRVPSKTGSVLLKGMEDAVLGIWTSHGEGRFSFRDEDARQQLSDCVALQFADDSGRPTERYPWNPNGSVSGVAALCSSDGRHLAMMPHADRSFLNWQLPSPLPPSPSDPLPLAPWMRLFYNAAAYCT